MVCNERARHREISTLLLPSAQKIGARFAIKIQMRGHLPLEAKTGSGVMGTVRAELRRLLRFIQQQIDRVRELRRIAGIDQKAGFLIADNLRYAAGARGDDGYSACEGLHDDKSECLRQGGVNTYVGRLIIERHLMRIRGIGNTANFGSHLRARQPRPTPTARKSRPRPLRRRASNSRAAACVRRSLNGLLRAPSATKHAIFAAKGRPRARRARRLSCGRKICKSTPFRMIRAPRIAGARMDCRACSMIHRDGAMT